MISDPCTHMSLSPACLCFLEFNFSYISKLWLSGEGAWWIMSVSLYVDEYESQICKIFSNLKTELSTFLSLTKWPNNQYSEFWNYVKIFLKIILLSKCHENMGFCFFSARGVTTTMIQPKWITVFITKLGKQSLHEKNMRIRFLKVSVF